MGAVESVPIRKTRKTRITVFDLPKFDADAEIYDQCCWDESDEHKNHVLEVLEVDDPSEEVDLSALDGHIIGGDNEVDGLEEDDGLEEEIPVETEEIPV